MCVRAVQPEEEKMYSLPVKNLKKFLEQPAKLTMKAWWLKEPGFKHLYVRHGRRYIQGQWYENILDIANVEARFPGRGTFTRFLEKIQKQYPKMGIYVESVQNLRFGAWLERHGFQWNRTSFDDLGPKSYFLLPKKN